MHHKKSMECERTGENTFTGLGVRDQAAGALSARGITQSDIERLSDLAADNKQALKELLARYRSAKVIFSDKRNSPVLSLYARCEMAFLRGQITDRKAIYRAAGADCKALRAEYRRRQENGTGDDC